MRANRTELEDEARKMRERSYMSYREIGKALGISKTQAHEYCNPDAVAYYNSRRARHHQSTPGRRLANIERCRRYRADHPHQREGGGNA